MNKIVLIRDAISNNEEKGYIKSVLPYDDGSDVNSIVSVSVRKTFHDVTELIINQLVESAIQNALMKNIYIMDSNNLHNGSQIYSKKTVRYFVEQRKKCGDIFLFAGSDKESKLTAKLWGFEQVMLS